MRIETRRRIANLISNTLNPFLVSVVLILLLSFNSTPSLLEGLKWSLILIALSILPVFSVIVYLVRSNRLESLFTTVRRQRTKIYLVAGVCAVIGCIILPYLGAPLILEATFVVGLSAILVFMCINLWWKISLHTAFVAGSAAILVILYGLIGAISVVLLPLIAWARIELNHHSLAQVASGALLAALIVVVVFYLFGLV